MSERMCDLVERYQGEQAVRPYAGSSTCSRC
jgi:hypothetical protein